MEENETIMQIDEEYNGCLYMTPKDASALTAIMHAGYDEVLVGSTRAFCFRHKEFRQLIEALDKTNEFLGPDGPLGIEDTDNLWTNCFVIKQVYTGRECDGIPMVYDLPMIEDEDLFLKFSHKICGIAPVVVYLYQDYTYCCDNEYYRNIAARNGWQPIETAVI